jgi:hypothetical protein
MFYHFIFHLNEEIFKDDPTTFRGFPNKVNKGGVIPAGISEFSEFSRVLTELNLFQPPPNQLDFWKYPVSTRVA